MTAEASTTAAPAAQPESSAPKVPATRPRRRPADLPFDFATAELVEVLVTERAEPDWLAADRRAAFAAYEALPIEGNQLYTTYVDLRPADLFGARPWVAVEAHPTTGRTPAVPAGDADADAVIELREDRVVALTLSDAARAAGVVVETFGAALERDPDRFRADLEGGSTLPADDKLAQLTRAAWSQGVRIVVPDGVRLEHPVLVRWASGDPGRAMLTRTLIRLGAGAAAAVVEELVPSGADLERATDETVPQGLFAGTSEVILGAGAALDLASIQEFGEREIVFQHRAARIGEGATLRWALAQLGGRMTKSRIDNRLEGDRSSVEQLEIVLGSADQRFDLTAYTRHVGRDTTGDLLAKGALLDSARSAMKGLITIERSAVGTDSYLGEFGMNLTRQARAVAIPSLEIDQPDCRRAAHSSSVGPIDPAQLFYLESRGIPLDIARRMIVLAFLEPVVARIPLEAARDRLRDLLEAKWNTSAAAGAAAAGPAADAA